ncbi:MAG TPA: tetratricopeptide repeat protein [Thermoanaerobaculia bacterium]|jgi:tetratricopeptide (TPR) repeat protein|nr:tetratricopeptide repeat protein [Thermoanaerobaculia bacterium]
MDHLAEKDFEDFWQDLLEPVALRRAVRHLASGCDSCRRLLIATAPRVTPFWRLERFPEEAYDAPIDRALRSVRKLLPKIEQDRERRDRGLALLRERGDWTSITPAENRSFQGLWPHIEILLQRSFDARYSNPKEMLDQAQTAQRVSMRLDGGRYGERLVFDLQARVWGELGNAFRVNEKYQEAGSAFVTAHRLLDQGTGDLSLRAHLWDLESSLRRAQRRFDEALDLLDEAHRAYRKLGNSQIAARTLMRMGNCQRHCGRLKEAVKTLRRSVAQLDLASDPHLGAIAHQNLLDALVDAGQIGEAGRLLLESGLRQSFADDPLNLLRVRWVEAKILAGHGRLTDAERVFGDVRAGFREHKLYYDAALAGVDLALARIKQGKNVWDLAWELYAESRIHGVHPQAIQAFHAFESLCRHKAITVPRVERLRGFLAQLQHDPRLTFDLELMVVG